MHPQLLGSTVCVAQVLVSYGRVMSFSTARTQQSRAVWHGQRLRLDRGLELCSLDRDVIWLSKRAYFHPRLRVYTLPMLEPLWLCDFKLKHSVYNFITLQYAQTLDHILYNDKFILCLFMLYISCSSYLQICETRLK